MTDETQTNELLIPENIQEADAPAVIEKIETTEVVVETKASTLETTTETQEPGVSTSTEEIVATEITVEAPVSETEVTVQTTEDPQEDPNTPNLDDVPEDEPVAEEASEGVDLTGLSRKECEVVIKEALNDFKIPYNSVVYAKGVATIECLGDKSAEPLVAALDLDLIGAPVHTAIVAGSAGRTVFKFAGE